MYSGECRDVAEYIIDIREYDVPYYIRCAIDQGMLPP